MRPSIPFSVFFILANLALASDPPTPYEASYERAAACNVQFRNLAGNINNHLPITKALFVATNDTDESVRFLKQSGTLLHIDTGNNIRGHAADFTSAKTGENDGFFN
jgi:hypothetical protein